MLLNMVRLRYADAPVFLEVTSIINQYALEGTVSANANLGGAFTGGDAFQIGGNALYSDRPTISYEPLTGQKFTRSLLTPIEPAALLSLVQASFPIDFVFGLSVRSINGINNASSTALDRQEADPRFALLLRAMRRVQHSRSISLRVKKRTGGDHHVVFVRKPMAENANEDLLFVRETLGLDPDLNEFSLVLGALPAKPDEIAILSRSVLEIMAELGSRFEVPQVHVEAHRVDPTPPEPDPDEVVALIRVRATRERPDEAFVAVRYLDHWYWIDSGDLQSKRKFTFMMILSNLADPGERHVGPILTIPTN